MRWLAAALLLVALQGRACDSEESSFNTRSKESVKSLRRQLMRDNSDYSHERASTPARLRGPARAAPSEREARPGERFDYDAERPAASAGDLLYYADESSVTNKSEDRKIYKTSNVGPQHRRSGALGEVTAGQAAGPVGAPGGLPELRLLR